METSSVVTVEALPEGGTPKQEFLGVDVFAVRSRKERMSRHSALEQME
jgi:hypothetical protein